MSDYIDNAPARAYLTSDVQDLTPEHIVGTTSDDTVKASHCSGLLIANKSVENYVEDCVDVVCVTHSTFDGLKLHPHGRNGITVKDRSRSVYFTQLAFFSHGSECDVELGQFSNAWRPGAAPTSGVLLAGPGAMDGKPVVIRVWDAELPEVKLGSPHRIVKVPKAVWLPYFLFRYALLRAVNLTRKLRNLKLVDTTPYLPGSLQRPE